MHLTAHLDIDLLALSTDEELTCLVELTAPTPPELATRPGQAIVVVLDRSGSMGGEPLDAAKRALIDLVRRLSPQDVFGLVTFDAHVELPVPVGRMSERPLDEIIAAIAGVEARGSTDLSAGYLMGLREASRALASEPAAGTADPQADTPLSGATVLVLSDGHANAGIIDPDQLAEVAAKAQYPGAQPGARPGARPGATTTSTLGLGQRYDEVILAALARGGSGEHRYAPDADAAVAEFAALVEDLLGKSVTGALLRVLPQQGLVDGTRVHGALPNWADAGAVTINLGDLYGGEERSVLVGLHVPALADLGTATVATLELSYTSLPDLQVHTVDMPVSVNVVPGDEARGRVPDVRVRVARLLLDADEAKRAAAERLRAGDSGAAQASLADAVERVRTGRDIAGDDEALMGRIDATVADLEELEHSTRERSDEWSSKLAMESYNQTSRGKQRRRARFVDEGYLQPFDDAGRLFGAAASRPAIHTVRGDIAQLARTGRFEAVVNAANTRLVGGSGVAGALHALAGPRLDRACEALVAASGPVAPGDAAATPGFLLGARHIVHSVGPRYGIDTPSDELLASAHRRAIEIADESGCTSVAIPAISTGVFGYPVIEAAPIAMRAVAEALTRCSSLRDVTFVLYDDVTLDVYRSASAGV
jgi:Ca-activated chloride channel family protein